MTRLKLIPKAQRGKKLVVAPGLTPDQIISSMWDAAKTSMAADMAPGTPQSQVDPDDDVARALAAREEFKKKRKTTPSTNSDLDIKFNVPFQFAEVRGKEEAPLVPKPDPTNFYAPTIPVNARDEEFMIRPMKNMVR